MRLILVHGINNEGNSAESIVNDWVDCLCAATGLHDTFSSVEVVAPFYGDQLAAFVNVSSPTVDGVIAQGGQAVPQEDAAFAAELLLEMAPSLGVTRPEIQELRGSGPVEQGLILDRVLHPLLALIENKVPGAGDFVIQFVQQANAYFNHPGAKKKIDHIVKPYLEGDTQQVVVAHSLGTVVTYSLLRGKATETTLYVTLGSPLSLRTVRQKLGPPYLVPDGVAAWLNGIDPSDPVALGQGLTLSNFSAGIRNVNDIDNGFGGKAHAIRGYLSDARIAGPIVEAIL